MPHSVVRRRWVLAPAAALALLALGTAPPTSAATRAGAAVTEASPGDAWTLTSQSRGGVAHAPAVIGNGFVSTRVPAAGAGFAAAPVPTQTHIAGVWADVRDLSHDAPQPEGAVNLPGWTGLGFVAGGDRYGLHRGTVRGYRQQLDLRTGTVTTSMTWESPSGRTTDLRYDVLLDRAQPRVGVVRLRVTPHWTGSASVVDTLGDGWTHHPDWLSSGLVRGTESVDPAHSTAALMVHATGTGIDVAYADRLAAPAGATATGSTSRDRTRLEAAFDVQSGRTYTTTKTVGFATSQDSDRPASDARAASDAGAAHGFEAVLAQSRSAWARLWRSDIVVPGDLELQRRLRAAQFYLMSSVAEPGQPGAGWSLSPVGLSSDGYNDHVFWDAETWMYPALLALHPDLARSVVDYRFRTRDGALANAAATGYDGMRFAWESALTGREVTPGWAETGRYEQHITADVALAQWQYYLATGDRGWLARRGWPVLRGATDFWASRATRNDDGSWSVTGVEGPDEHHYPVDDSAYTNVAAKTALDLASRAAVLTGNQVPARWGEVADGLVVPAPGSGSMPAHVRPEFRGYTGDVVKQADTVMLTYPWEYRQSRAVDLADLRYYAQRYDPDGPAMTDSVNSIVWAQLRPAGCADWTWTRRSMDPFVVPPYAQFTEARSGQGVFTFLTGEGGFLQEFLYGYPGLRWREDSLRLDPTLPPQLAGGLQLRHVHWRGRVVDVDVRRSHTTVSLVSGPAMTVSTPAGDHQLPTGGSLALATARPDEAATDNLALCRPVTASSSDPSAPPEGAVDGERATGWSPTTARARLTVTLADHSVTDGAVLAWAGDGAVSYRVQVETPTGVADRRQPHRERSNDPDGHVAPPPHLSGPGESTRDEAGLEAVGAGGARPALSRQPPGRSADVADGSTARTMSSSRPASSAGASPTTRV